MGALGPPTPPRGAKRVEGFQSPPLGDLGGKMEAGGKKEAMLKKVQSWK